MEQLGITIYPHQDKRKELLGACKMISNQTLHESGCVDCHVLLGSGEKSPINLEQHWQQRSLLDDYFRSDHFSALLGAMKLLADNYEVKINYGTHAEGISVINRARRKK